MIQAQDSNFESEEGKPVEYQSRESLSSESHKVDQKQASTGQLGQSDKDEVRPSL